MAQRRAVNPETLERSHSASQNTDSAAKRNSVYGLAEASLAVTFPRCTRTSRRWIEREIFFFHAQGWRAQPQKFPTSLSFSGHAVPKSRSTHCGCQYCAVAGSHGQGLWFRGPSATSGTTTIAGNGKFSLGQPDPEFAVGRYRLTELPRRGRNFRHDASRDLIIKGAAIFNPPEGRRNSRARRRNTQRLHVAFGRRILARGAREKIVIVRKRGKPICQAGH